MPWKFPRPRFGLRTLLVAVLLVAIGLAFYTSPGRWRTYRNHQARQRINPYELTIAGEGNPRNVPPELVAILGDSRLKHWRSVSKVEWVAGDHLASQGTDQITRVWDSRTGRQIEQYSQTSIAASGDRNTLFLGTPEGPILLWDAKTGRVVNRLDGFPGWRAITMGANENGRVLACDLRQGEMTQRFVVWDVPNKRVQQELPSDAKLRGYPLVTPDGTQFGYRQDNQIFFHDVSPSKSRVPMRPIPEERRNYYLGTTALLGDKLLLVGSMAGGVVAFDPTTGEELFRTPDLPDNFGFMASDASTSRIVVANKNSFLFYDLKTKDAKIVGATSHLRERALSLDWDGSHFAAGHEDHGISLWAGMGPVRPQRIAGDVPTALTCLAFDPRQRWIVTGNRDGHLAQWEFANWRMIRSWQAHSAPVRRLEVSSDGSRLASTADDGLVMWDAESGQELWTNRSAWPAVFSPDGQRLVTTGRGNKPSLRLLVLNSRAGAIVAEGPKLFGRLCGDPSWSPDGRHFAGIDQGQSLLELDTATWTPTPIGVQTQFAQGVAVKWLSDNQRFVTGGWDSDEVHILQVGKTTPVATIRAGGGLVKHVALHPSEQWIALCGEDVPVQIWHLPTQKLVKSWQIGPPKGIVSQVEFSPDGHYLATVNGNGTAYVLSLDGVLGK